MTPKPHDVVDLRLAPVALQLDARLEALGRLSADALVSRVVMENNHPLSDRRDREQDLLFTVTRAIDLGGWVASWDERGLRLAHGKHTLVLGLPGSLSSFLAAGSDAVRAGV